MRRSFYRVLRVLRQVSGMDVRHLQMLPWFVRPAAPAERLKNQSRRVLRARVLFLFFYVILI